MFVRDRLYHSKKWNFFPDFLRDYVPEVLGLEWCRAEAAKPECERHPLITWRAHGARDMNAQLLFPNSGRGAVTSGAFAAYTYFAYDLFVVDNNGSLDEELIRRLKNRELFQGARHELFAEATCYRAGFSIEHENEKDGLNRHAEFTARHGVTGETISIEAKSRHRTGVLGRKGAPKERPDFNLGPLINDAVAKNTLHPLAIFVDVNMPAKWAERVLGRCAGGVSEPVRRLLDRVNRAHGNTDPYELLIITNHPHHYASDGMDPEKHLLSVVAQRPISHIPSLMALHQAANLYGNVPNDFTEDNDELLPALEPARWRKTRYDLRVRETEITIFQEGELLPRTFSTRVKDRPEAPSPLHDFLEDIGLSRWDAAMVCRNVEDGESVLGVFAPKASVR